MTSKTEREREHEFILDKIREYTSKSLTQREIATKLQISLGSVNAGLKELRTQAKQNIIQYIDHTLPQEFDKIHTGLELVNKNCWQRYDAATTDKERYMFLSLAKDTYQLKAALLDSNIVLDRAIKFITSTRGLIPQIDKVVIDTNNLQAQSDILDSKSRRISPANPGTATNDFCTVFRANQAQNETSESPRSGGDIPAAQAQLERIIPFKQVPNGGNIPAAQAQSAILDSSENRTNQAQSGRINPTKQAQPSATSSANVQNKVSNKHKSKL